MLKSKSRCLKMVGRKNFTIELLESHSGSFYIAYEKRNTPLQHSEPIRDLKLALDLFEIKLQELECN